MRRLLSERTAGFDRSITIFEDVPRVELGLTCPRLQRHIALSECLGCQYHQATLTSAGGYGVFCRFPVNVAGPMPGR